MPMGIGLGIGVTRGGGVGWWPAGSELAFEFDNGRGFNSIDRTKTTPDSILTYTSPSPKLVYGSDGVLRYAPHNLLTFSEQFDNAAWVKSGVTIPAASINAAVAPDGTTTADLLVTDTTAGDGLSYVQQIVSGGAISIYAKVGSAGFLGLSNGNYGIISGVNLSTGAVTYAFDASFTPTVTNVGGGWYRVALNSLTADSNRIRVYSSTTEITSARTVTGDGVSGIYIWGAQINRGSSALTYIPTTSAAVYSLPIDHNPTTFAPLGVLIEEERKNLLTYSNLVGGWGSLTTGNTLATGEADPTGGTSGTLYTRTATVSYRGQSVSKAASAITYTQSFYVKKDTANYAAFTMQGFNSGQRLSQSVNLATGELSAATTAGAFAHVGSSVDTLIDNWYRVKIVFTTDTHTVVSAFITFATSAIITVDSVDSASTATGYVWGAQLEAGAFPTSYIPTVASQVTRLADQVSILTSAFAYNATAGTMVVDGRVPLTTASARAFTFDNGSINNQIVVEFGSGNAVGTVLDGLSVQASIGLATAVGPNKVAFAFAANDFAESVNGGAAATDLSGTIPTITGLQIGRRAFSASVYLNSHIKRLTYFPTRRTNADLQVLST